MKDLLSCSQCNVEEWRANGPNTRSSVKIEGRNTHEIYSGRSETIFSEESRRIIHELGNLELYELGQKSRTVQCHSCYKPMPEGLKLLHMRNMPQTKRRYNETNWNTIKNLDCVTLVCPYQQLQMQKVWWISMAKRSLESEGRHKSSDKKKGKDAITLRWQQDEQYRESQMVHGWTEEYCKYLDYLQTIDIDCAATWWHRHRYESTVTLAMTTKDRQCGPMNRRSKYNTTARSPMARYWFVWRFSSQLETVCAGPIWGPTRLPKRKIENGDSAVFWRQCRVQTLANVVHATECEDRTPRRTRNFLNLVVSSTRTPEHFENTHVRVAQVCTSHFALVMFGVVCTIAHPKHLFILDVSSPSSRSPSWVVQLVFLHTIAATSDNMLYETGEGIADWNQVPLWRDLAREEVWPTQPLTLNGWILSDLCRRTRQGSTNLVRKSCQEHSSDARWLREDLEGRHFGCRHWGGGKIGRVRNPRSKAQCKGNDRV